MGCMARWFVGARKGMPMVKFLNLSKFAPKPPFTRMTATQRGLLYGAALTAALCLSGCVVEVLNRQPAEELKQLASPPGSVYTGWRVFQDKCAGCHAPAATGTAGGPDLLPLVRDMGPRQFVSLVLNRYDWVFPVVQIRSESTQRDDLIEDLVQRKQYMLTMPAWQGEPRVNAHIVDLYAYLSARASGAQGPGRPAP